MGNKEITIINQKITSIWPSLGAQALAWFFACLVFIVRDLSVIWLFTFFSGFFIGFAVYFTSGVFIKYVTAFGCGIIPFVWYFSGLDSFFLHIVVYILSSTTTSVAVYGAGYLLEGRAKFSLINSMEGQVQESSLQQINISDFPLKTVEEVMTVVVIQIYGIDYGFDGIDSEVLVNKIRYQSAAIQSKVNQAGGFVRRSEGGILYCFFGYDPVLNKCEAGHGDTAVRCALALQKMNLSECRHALAASPVFPLKFGINTCPVTVGDLGNRYSADLMVVGSGINIALDLMSACEPFSILMTDITKIILKDSYSSNELFKRMVQVSHFDQLVESWEFNPSLNKSSHFDEAMSAFRQYANRQRREQRWPVRKGLLWLEAAFGRIDLHNFSSEGFAADTPEYLSKGVMLYVHIRCSIPEIDKKLLALEFMPVIVEVRWGKPLAEDLCLHGLAIKNLSAEDSALLMLLCREAVAMKLPEKRA